MDAEGLTDTFPDYENQVSHTEHLPAESADARPAEEILPRPLADTLPHDTLYSHQIDALSALEDGDDVCVTTSTASGKTLIYALHIARKYLANSNTALLIYPTKALARDQQQDLQQLYNRLGLDINVGVYDGDTTRDEKDRVRDECDVIITNFVGLNFYLPHHPSWTRFFMRLDTLVIDEAHTYTGIEGMHVAWVIRRLLRIVRSRDYAANPQMVLTSATIGNPAGHAQALTGRDVTVINNDGSPRGPRDIVLWNPPTYQTDSGDLRRKSSHKEASRVLAYLTANDMQSLMFVPSRRMSELCAQWAEEYLDDQYPEANPRIEPYHAGHTKQERRSLETSLKTGEVDGVVSTSALEVGIDVGSVDATVLDGYPGSRMSFWQQLGRAGRGDSSSLTVMVAQNDSIDQFITNNPGYLFSEDVEDAVVDLGNPDVYEKHLITAAREKPLRYVDSRYFGDAMPDFIEDLKRDGVLDGSLDDRVTYTAKGRPEADINIYGTSGESFDVRLNAPGEAITLPPVDPARAYREFHPNAIYIHRGQQYRVTEFDEDKRTIYLDPEDVGYRTQANRQVDIVNIDASEKYTVGEDITVYRGTGTIQEQYTMYDKVYDNGGRDAGYSTGLTDPLQLKTDMFWMTFDDEEWLNVQEMSDGPALGALHAAEHALIKMAPTELMVDSDDLGGLSIAAHPETTKPTLFVYDGVNGGLGFSHAMYETLPTLAQSTKQMIDDCACDSASGCPACVMDYMCGDNNEPLDTPGARYILEQFIQ